jgi:hypothetical protein
MEHDIRSLTLAGTPVLGDIDIKATVRDIIADPVLKKTIGRQQDTAITGHGDTRWANEPNSLLGLSYCDGTAVTFDAQLWLDQETVTLKGWARLVGLTTESQTREDRTQFRHSVDFEVTDLDPVTLPDGTEFEFKPVRFL